MNLKKEKKISKSGTSEEIKKNKNLFFCKVLNENENIKNLMLLGKRPRKLPRITTVNAL